MGPQRLLIATAVPAKIRAWGIMILATLEGDQTVVPNDPGADPRSLWQGDAAAEPTEGLLQHSAPCEDDEASATFGCNPVRAA